MTSNPERIVSPEFQLTAELTQKISLGPTLTFTLRDIGHRTLIVDTGEGGYPLANFAFSLELPNHQWLSLDCSSCTPGSLFGQFGPYSLSLGPSQSHSFSLPLSALCAADPHTGDRIEIRNLHGRVLIELHVPTPPDGVKHWPGYVSAAVSLP